MQFDIVTIFPDFFAGPLDYGIVRRAREAGLMDARVHDLRAFTHDRHRTVDDRPFGGGEGMVLKPEPLFEAVESLLNHFAAGAQFTVNVHREEHAVPAQDVKTSGSERGTDDATISQQNAAIVLLSASGKLFRQDTARRFAALDRIILLCGRYEGVDERVAQHLATDELSIGDFVLSGGELAAALIMDAVTRLIPGALGNEDSTVNESFSAAASRNIALPTVTNHESPVTSHQSLITNRALLDFPHYTRPAEFRGWPVPEILLGGNHEHIRLWRQQKALEKTRKNRPDLL
ncbi:MAG: tRNA (guanine(37)-N(1))-methyltransferase [Candidatus Acidiferrales bacterium]|jgi:tRNA (guanine37-N1)-methyltransferase